MTYITNRDFCQQPIERHPFSKEFIARCKALGLYRLSDIFALRMERVIKPDMLDVAGFNELIDYLEHQGRLYLFVR